MLNIRLITLLIISLSFGNCNSSEPETIPEAPANTATPNFQNVELTTDKAYYKPSDNIVFTLNSSTLPTEAKVRYKHLNTIVSESNLTALTWTWIAPATDFTGYMAEVYSINNGTERIHATVGIDVSSVWTKFPRYGFLGDFGQITESQMSDVIANMNKHHINGIQFYDWLGKHHQPMTMNGASPASFWKDIANRDTYFSTVQSYISLAHSRNMKTMFYDLVYGAWENAENDGVQKEWYLYNDNTHTNRDFLSLPSPFLSDLFLLDPSNTAWQDYMKKETKKVYDYLEFDGYHMDQVGDRGTRYKYDGTYLNLANSFKSYIDAIENFMPAKYNVMNAVTQYGQQGIATAGTDFLYSEVWTPYDKFSDLANIIKQNNSYSNNAKNTVLAAYMNYDLANNKGYFNTASILMTNAVIFAFGGSHLELGEHMLCKEYFPNNNLTMRDDLKTALVKYYDFLVAYQNILRDGGTFNNVTISSVDQKLSIENWPGSQGKVAVFGKKLDKKQIIHLINFSNSTTQNWRDNTGIQVPPAMIKDAKMVFTSSDKVSKIWVASPDFVGGMARSLNFNQSGNKISFILPELQYWDMIVVEY